MPPGEKHEQLTMMAMSFLNSKITRKGMRCSTEVYLNKSYLADAVALCSFQNRFYQAYCSYSQKQPIVVNTRIVDGKRKDSYSGEVANYFACVFEAKATRSDFLSTFSQSQNHWNRHYPIGSLHWCVTPRKLIKPEELPDFWGLLEEYGSGLREVKLPKINILSKPEFDSIVHRLIWPLQAKRKYTQCAECGRYIRVCYCNRCSFKRQTIT